MPCKRPANQGFASINNWTGWWSMVRCRNRYAKGTGRIVGYLRAYDNPVASSKRAIKHGKNCRDHDSGRGRSR
eukprot:11826296-Alexandrium_andersonii.AAC.1